MIITGNVDIIKKEDGFFYMKIVEIPNNPIDSYLAIGIANGFFIVENQPNIKCRFTSIEDCRKALKWGKYMVENQPKKDTSDNNKEEIIETRSFKLYLDNI